jgi:hypothetical protein
VLIWAAQGYFIAQGVFGAQVGVSWGTAASCALVVYLMERLVLATPNTASVAVLRLLIGVVVAVLGAAAVDLTLFKREIEQQLRSASEAQLAARHKSEQQTADLAAAAARSQWLSAQAAASCEADGTCGSRVRSVGPVYRELARQAERLRADFERQLAQAQALQQEQRVQLQSLRASSQPLDEAGLLARLQALHDYISGNPVALGLWLLMFALVLAMELLVVFAKFSFGDTVDDHLDRLREQLALHQARSYVEAVTSPLAGAHQALEGRWD